MFVKFAVLAVSFATASQTVTVEPEDNGRLLLNPDMGWVMHYYDNGPRYGTTIETGDNLKWFPGCSIVYLRLPWAHLEPEEGKYNWNCIDTPAQQWLSRGGHTLISKIVFSVITYINSITFIS